MLNEIKRALSKLPTSSNKTGLSCDVEDVQPTARFNATFAASTLEQTKARGEAEIAALDPAPPPKPGRKKIRSEHVSIKVRKGTRALLSQVAKNATGKPELTIGLELIIADYCERHGLPIPKEDD